MSETSVKCVSMVEIPAAKIAAIKIPEIPFGNSVAIKYGKILY